MAVRIRPQDVLRECYERNGCLRIRSDDPDTGRHGGVELRLVVGDPAERREVRAALKTFKIFHGKIYRKEKNRKQWVIPMYARVDIVNFLKSVKPKGYTKLVREVLSTAKRRPIRTTRRRRAKAPAITDRRPASP
ncbi:MAG: hypothetical protein GXP54_12780 [Deltaproteobacteria bacterium]|nr:hypothetical protein [Deltaproteobacteria bacterium]